MYFIYSDFLITQVPQDLNYVQTLDRCVNYDATLLTTGSRMFAYTQGSLEDYVIDGDGNLILNSYLDIVNQNGSNIIMNDDYLFVEVANHSNFTEINKINILDNSLEIEQVHNLNTTNSIYKMDVNENYLFYVLNGQTTATILNIGNMEVCGNLETGSFFQISDNTIFYQMNYDNSNYLFIDDITEVSNPINLCSVFLSNNQQNVTYLIEYPYLFIGQNQQIIILNINNLNSPQVISIIDNIVNIPYMNFFTSILRINDYLLIKNQDNNIWVYNIENLENPIFMNFVNDFGLSTCYKNGFCLKNNFIYLAQAGQNIFKFAVDELPELNLITSYGLNGFFSYCNYSYPYIVYYNQNTGQVKAINIAFAEPIIFELCDDSHLLVNTFYFEEDILAFIIADQYAQKHLNIYYYDLFGINFVASIPINNEFEKVSKIGNYLGLLAPSLGEIQICNINPDFTIDYLNVIYPGDYCNVALQTSHCSNDQVFVTWIMNNQRYVTIYETEYPFNEIGTFSLSQFGSYINQLYRLTNDRILVFGYVDPQCFNKLAIFNSLDDIQVIDSYTTNNGYFTLHNDLLVYRKYFSQNLDYFSWANDQLSEIGSIEFETEVANNFFNFENSELYSYGRFSLRKYSCNYVSVKDNQILNPDLQLTNYPNPFNPSTTISFELTAKDAKNAKLEIYNIKGQKVKTLLDCKTAPGKYNCVWNGRNETGKRVSSGQYTARLTINGEEMAVRKMMVVK
jgi:hypothetical protein